MSFRINTNVNAMNAMRNLSQTNDSFSNSITKLSTGLRINSAADDPSGLISSEKFRSQIGGLDQSIKNNQDAINYAKTAEGAFNEVSTLLKDARTLAVASANTATLSASQIQANQTQLKSITDSITRIANTTTYGTKKLLDGSSGTTSAVTAGDKLNSLNIGGSFAGAAVTSSSTVSINSLTAATQASVTTATFASQTTAVSAAGSFSLNGVTFTASASTTAGDLINSINKANGQTGVTASWNGTAIDLKSDNYGSNGKIDLVDANGVIRSAGAGTDTSTGTDATATVALGSATALFTGSVNGNGGLTLTDADNNTISLTAAGNATTSVAAAVGQVIAGAANFQIGANSGQTASLSIGNFASSQLGTGAVSGLNLSNLDLTTASGASSAISVIDKAIDDVSRTRGNIGSFQRNVLETNIRSQGVAKENLSAADSTIRDTDIASEMTNYTKLQILQQAGMSVLTQANSAPQAVLSLLRG